MLDFYQLWKLMLRGDLELQAMTRDSYPSAKSKHQRYVLQFNGAL